MGEQDIEKIVATFNDYKEIKRYSKIVSFNDIAANDFNLNIRRYADTAPPAEIYDVRAIFHGGIPVREVQDDYIQEEVIQGFDLSVVFDRKNDAYFMFKPEITTKEQIRVVIEECSSGIDTKVITLVIKQLKRWWDKYQVSLHQLDEEVSAAEQVMHCYLKELGYDMQDAQLPQANGCARAAE